MRKKHWYGSVGKILIFLFFCVFAIAIIVPLIWMILSSLKNNTEFLSDPWLFRLFSNGKIMLMRLSMVWDNTF